jgi:hypothetical protein
MAENDMAAATTFFHTGATYYGESSVSHIDHLMIPVQATQLISSIRADRIKMKRLQLVVALKPVDHCPVVFRIRATLDHQTKTDGDLEQRLDMDRVMIALTKGPGQQRFLDTIEELTGQIRDEEWNSVMEDRTTDRAWTMVADIIKEAGTQHFSQPKKDDPLKHLSQYRRDLLQKRIDLRGNLPSPIDDTERLSFDVGLDAGGGNECGCPVAAPQPHYTEGQTLTVETTPRAEGIGQGPSEGMDEATTPQHRRTREREEKEDELVRVKLELTMLSHRLGQLRRRWQKERVALWLEELWESWQRRDFATMHRMRALLAGTGYGPKKRFYRGPGQLAVTTKEWSDFAAMPATEGGMTAIPRTFDEQQIFLTRPPRTLTTRRCHYSWD